MRCIYQSVLCWGYALILTITNGLDVRDGGYDDVVVAISDQVDPQYCADIINNMKAILTKASRYFHESTEQRLYFRSFHILLPSGWDCSGIPDEIKPSTFQTFDGSDIRIHTSHPVYGNAPWTEQYGGCKVKGSFMQMGFEYLTNNQTSPYGPKDRVIVHEWAKLRFGVFDEYGFPGDPLYPTFYGDKSADGTDVKVPNFCTDTPIVGSEETVSWNPDQSVFIPDPEKNTNVLSSVMSVQFLSNVRSFCDSTNHQQKAPTKHNALCDFSSSWDIIRTSQDMKDQPIASQVTTTPTFTVVRKTKQRIMLLVDGSRRMRDYNRIEIVRDALINYLLHVSLGVKIGMVLYKNETTLKNSLTEVTEQNRENMFTEAIEPGSEESSKYLIDGVNMALQELQKDSEGTHGAHIVLITCESNRPARFEEVRNIITKHKMFTHVIGYPDDIYSGFRQLALETRGKFFLIPEKIVLEGNPNYGPEVYYGTVMNIITSLTSVMDEPDVLGQRLKYSEVSGQPESISSIISGNFTVTPGITWLRFTINFVSQYGISSESLKDPNGKSVIAKRKEGLREYITTEVTPGRWSYSFQTRVPYPQVNLVEVRFKRRPEEMSQMESFTVWTSWDDLRSPDIRIDPLIVYLKALKGDKSIVGANITVLLTQQGPSGSKITVDVVDDGLGQPDVQQGDGIYSGYFLGILPSEVDYKVTAHIQSTPGVTSFVSGYQSGRINRRLRNFYENRVLPQESNQIGVPYCCGSKLPSNIKTEPLNFDPVSIEGPILFTSTSVASLEDIYPPGKVVDLQNEENARETSSEKFTLRWTAPGSDYNKGTVKYYDIRFSEAYKSLISNFEDCRQVRLLTDTHIAGTIERLTELGASLGMNLSQPYYVAMKAHDGTRFGKLSNIVAIKLVLPVTGSEGPTTEKSPEASTIALTFTQIVGIILGLFFLLLLILVIIICCVCCKRREKKVKQRKEDKMSITYPSDRKVGYDNMPYGNGKSDVGNPVYTISPVSWTASQLLSEHEKRRPSPNMSPNINHQNLSDSFYRAASVVEDALFNLNGSVDPNGGIKMIPDPEVGVPEPHPFVDTSSVLGSSFPSDSYLSLASDREKRKGPPTLPKPRTHNYSNGYHPIYSQGSTHSGSSPTDPPNKTYRNITEV